MRARPIQILALVFLLAVPAAGQQAPFGPIEHEEGSPLYRLFYTPLSETPDPVERGSFRITTRWAYANIFEYSLGREVEQYFDVERLTTSLALRYGATGRLELGARVRFEHMHGGFLDGFITGFHEAFGLPNADREKFPEDAFGLFLVEEGGDVRMNVPRRSFGLDEVRLFGKWLAHRSHDGRQALSFRAAARIPGSLEAGEAEDGVPEQAVNLSAGVLGRSSHAPWHWHGMLGVNTVRGDERLTELLHPLALHFLLGGERELGESWSIVAQFLGSTPYVKGLGSSELDRPSLNLVMGFAGGVGQDWRWQFSFTEDVPPNSPSVDFTVALVVSRGW